ncbi:DUF58 domain-containing protein [Alkalilimnicola ehrlichii]|uniref:Uncharacterized protein n=1 Tax=Alkalilimnicola ehrlichii TaxID=351052 RepID=A0A3E0WRK3_9GAMM|nr:DUF58 domain-containing protein [Alkalilimnicola ehrlichii]RFA34823.1 hypothetical protein CAL65_14040 [Alkalilimnicola ehrlichii]
MRLVERLPEGLQAWLVRGDTVGQQPIGLRYRRIFILPTRAGLGYTGMLIVMWLAAMNYGNSMAFALAFLLAGLALVFTLHCFRNLLGLELRCQPPEPVFAGANAAFPLQLNNRSRRPRLGIELHREGSLQEASDIAPYDSTVLTLQRKTTARGVVAAGRSRIISRFPGGLVFAWSWIDVDSECLVYPRPADTGLPLRFSGTSDSLHKTAGEDQDDFHGVRRYQAGDPLNRVNWHSIARGLPPQTKLYQSAAQNGLWFDWHRLEGMDNEQRLSQLCRWILDAEEQGLRYGLRLPHTEVAPGQGAPTAINV